MTNYLTLIPAFFGSLGFLLFFSTDKKHPLMGSLNGALGWLVFLIIKDLGGSLFLCSLIGALVASIAPEILARVYKAPSTIFYIGGIVPMVPGSNLYYMVEAFFNGNMERAIAQGAALLWTILGMAVGAAVVLGVLWTIRRAKRGH